MYIEPIFRPLSHTDSGHHVRVQPRVRAAEERAVVSSGTRGVVGVSISPQIGLLLLEYFVEGK